MFRFFTDDACSREGDRVRLSPALQRHLKAARVSPGENFVLVFPAQSEAFRARLDSSEKGAAVLEESMALAGTGPVAIELAIGISKMDALEAAVAAAAELGAVRVRLLQCERAAAKDLSANKRERLERIAVSGAEVAGRASAPEIVGPTPIAKLTPGEDAGFVFWEEDTGGSFAAVLAKQKPATAATLVIGPEGGLAPGEVQALETAGFVRAGLGPRILRARTAPLVALSILQAVWGDLR